MWVGFCLNLERKMLCYRGIILNPTEIAKVPRLRDRHVFMRQSLGIFNVPILELKNEFFEKGKTFSKNWSIVFWLKVLRLKTQDSHTKLPCQKPI